MLRLFRCVVALGLVILGARADAADIDFKFGGQISSDIRFRLGSIAVPSFGTNAPYPSQYRLLGYGFSRNENTIKAQLSLSISDKVKAVADVDFVFYGYSDIKDLESATYRERIDPYWIEAHAAYVDIYRILPKLDLRIGRQVVNWGTADKFNPTNNINTLDYFDPLLFGKALANNMIRLDFNPWKDLILTAVWVPIFRPARLPRTAPIALTDRDRPAPIQDARQRDSISFLQELMPPNQINAWAIQREASIENSQIGVRLSGNVLKQDVSLSYYRGFFGIPVPAWTVNAANSVVDVSVIWPRMQVLGFDLAGTIPKLGGLGYWFEGAVIFPQEVAYTIYNDASGQRDPVTFADDGTTRLGYPEGKRAIVIPSTPFLKATVGVDYSFNKYLYGNLQYVHGFIDEFGAGIQPRPPATPGGLPRVEQRLGDYFVLGADLKLFSDVLLIRAFGAFKIPSIGDYADTRFTAVLFPQLVWSVWDATELTVGSFVFLGDRSTKFGDPAAGATEIFAKARFTY